MNIPIQEKPQVKIPDKISRIASKQGLKIGLDFDGVIENCGELKTRGAKELFGIEIPIEFMNRSDAIKRGYLTQEQLKQLYVTVYGTREFGLSMKLVNCARSYIADLKSSGHEILVVTNRVDSHLEVAKEWSRQQRLDLDFVGIPDGTSKATALEGFDVFVEDDFNKLKLCYGIARHLFLFSWPYNEKENVQGIARRVYDWQYLYGGILKLI